jgi:hypothetical protein
MEKIPPETSAKNKIVNSAPGSGFLRFSCKMSPYQSDIIIIAWLVRLKRALHARIIGFPCCSEDVLLRVVTPLVPIP